MATSEQRARMELERKRKARKAGKNLADRVKKLQRDNVQTRREIKALNEVATVDVPTTLAKLKTAKAEQRELTTELAAVRRTLGVV
jgi:hypothetical protein